MIPRRRIALLALLAMLPALLQGCLATSLLSFLPFLPKFASTAVSGAHFLYTYALDERSTRDMVADKTITMQAKAALTQGGLDDAVNVTVHCYAGHVYLVGQLDSPEERDAAVQSVEALSGVQSVTPVITLEQDAGTCNSAGGYLTAQRIHAATLDQTMLATNTIEVAQTGCDLVLLGMVNTVSDANRIVARAQSIAGAQRIRSHLIVTSDPALTPQLAMVDPPTMEATAPSGDTPGARAAQTVLASNEFPRTAPGPKRRTRATDGRPLPAQARKTGEIRYVNTAVNVRGSRTSKARVTARLQPGEQVRVRYLENNWFAVYDTAVATESESQAIGYVFAPLLLRPTT